MQSLLKSVEARPGLVRVAPFAVFVGLTAVQGAFGLASAYWVYLLKTVLGGLLLWVLRRSIVEMRWKISWEGVLTGIAVFVIWVGLDGYYPKLMEILQRLGGSASDPGGAGSRGGWNPFGQFGEGAAMAWFFVVVRIGGSTLIVPPLEEVFYRSFLYRWLARPDFTAVSLGAFMWLPFILTSLMFGLAHHEWLAGILCACAYQGLVCWKKRLGDAMTAHAVTNCLLGMWVVWKGAWQFW